MVLVMTPSALASVVASLGTLFFVSACQLVGWSVDSRQMLSLAGAVAPACERGVRQPVGACIYACAMPMLS
jgi:hypothetical protein